MVVLGSRLQRYLEHGLFQWRSKVDLIYPNCVGPSVRRRFEGTGLLLPFQQGRTCRVGRGDDELPRRSSHHSPFTSSNLFFLSLISTKVRSINLCIASTSMFVANADGSVSAGGRTTEVIVHEKGLQ